ncbi:MAG: NADH dehydrogenase [Desulfobacca sp. 4484_104]|nr:MAG: NADH dehydrogenase [Desulfobacca sp. 4484_104]RLA87862.1 MAG: NADH-quinone oxidoreductase subunit D [Deltaproteobacteria bacterium]
MMLEPGIEEKTFYLNLGPQHPSTHGVLRILLEMDGEFIANSEPVIGYGHRAHEKMAELRTYQQYLPNMGRVDYLHALAYNHGYCLAVERLAGIEVPERAEFIRVITSELNRIASHLLWFGAYLLDLGAFTPFLYCFDDRENVVDILDRVTGSRLTYCYFRFGGVRDDIDDEFIAGCRAFITRLRSRWQDYDDLVTKNVIFINRTRDVGIITPEQALKYGVTGPCLRGSGIPYDIRRSEPYSVYPLFDFEIPIGERGDIMDRYVVRLREMEQSLRIIEQALDKLPNGPIMAEKVPKRLKPAEGEVYAAVESGRGEFGTYIVSKGDTKPYRIKLRVPSFSNLSIISELIKDTLVADMVAILGSLDLVIPEVDR